MSLLINGIDPAAYGLQQRRRVPPPAIGEETQVLEVLGAAGGIRSSGNVRASALDAEGTVLGVASATAHPLTATPAQLRSNLSSLRLLLSGDQAVGLGEFTDREWHGYLARATGVDISDPQVLAVDARVSLRWTLPDPFAIAVAETITPLVSGVAGISIGDAPCPLRLEVFNDTSAPVTSITAILQRGNVALQTVVWTGSLPVGSVWIMDDESFSVTVDGVNAIDGLSAASVFLWADPLDMPSNVTLATVGGAGASSCVRYHKRWW